MNRRAAISLIGVPAVLASAGPLGAQVLIPVRVGASTDDGVWPLVYAMQSGIFQKNGLDVKLSPLANGAALAAAVIGGAVDIAKSSLMVLIAAHARGIGFKIVAGAAMHDSHNFANQLTVLKDSPFTSLGQVGGRTIAVNVLNSLEVYGTRLLIEKSGGDSSTVKFVEMPFGAMLSALEQGQCDVASIGNPSLTANLQSGKIRSLGVPYNGIGPRFLIAGWFCTASYVAANRAATTRFAEAIRQATIYTNSHPAEIIPMVAAYSHLELDTLKAMHFLTNATSVDPEDIQPSIDAAVRYKVILSGFPASELIAS
jgi:NitT/TauT family transport system substrate-binding protein